jgi:hypothetical protein
MPWSSARTASNKLARHDLCVAMCSSVRGQGAVRARRKRRGEERRGRRRGGKGEGQEKRAGVAKIDGGVQGGRSPPAIFSDMAKFFSVRLLTN